MHVHLFSYITQSTVKRQEIDQIFSYFVQELSIIVINVILTILIDRYALLQTVINSAKISHFHAKRFAMIANEVSKDTITHM